MWRLVDEIADSYDDNWVSSVEAKVIGNNSVNNEAICILGIVFMVSGRTTPTIHIH